MLAAARRIFAAARGHSFAEFAQAVDRAFARWDLSHLHEFTLADGVVVSPKDWWDGDEPAGMLDGRATRLARLSLREQFAYVYDLGDMWTHLCTVGEKRIDPVEELGLVPDRPEPYWGWGGIPDQHGRRWNGDDGETPAPPAPAPALSDLPPILPGWGGTRRR